MLIVSCTPSTLNIDKLSTTNINGKDKGDEILFYNKIENSTYIIKRSYNKIPPHEFEGKTGIIVGEKEYGTIIVLVDSQYYQMESAFVKNESINKKKLNTEKEKWIGKTIWLGRVKNIYGVPMIKSESIIFRYFNPYSSLTDKEKDVHFEDFEDVKVIDIVTYSGFFDRIILKISSDNGQIGYINSSNNDEFYSTDYAYMGRYPIYYGKNPFDASWSSKYINDIKEGKVIIGMSKEQVMLAWGKPFENYTSAGILGYSETWYYGEYGEYGVLDFINGELSQISRTK